MNDTKHSTQRAGEAHGAGMTYHMAFSVSLLYKQLAMLPGSGTTDALLKNGMAMRVDEAMAYLIKLRDLGFEVVPSCDRTDERGYCRGHRARRNRNEHRQVEKRVAEAKAYVRGIVKRGVCPQCGAALKRNTSMTGWWQCEQYGAPSFRADPSAPACDFQTFTE